MVSSTISNIQLKIYKSPTLLNTAALGKYMHLRELKLFKISPYLTYEGNIVKSEYKPSMTAALGFNRTLVIARSHQNSISIHIDFFWDLKMGHIANNDCEITFR